MPSYVYECLACEQWVTVFRGINDPEVKPVCVLCGEVMARLFNITGVSFKGNGWGHQAR